MLTIQVLIENNLPPEVARPEAPQSEFPQPTTARNFIAEHGLSFWIEKEGHRLIFDTGKSGAFVQNAELLGIDLSSAEALVVSHGHYDHGGGLRTLAETAHYRGPLWTGPGFFDPKWSNESPRPRYLGLDVDRLYLESCGISCHELERGNAPSILQQGAHQGQAQTRKGAVKEILPGIFILGNFIRTHADEIIAPRFTVVRSGIGQSQADTFDDEICVVIPLPQGLVVLVGCAHPGLMNILDTAQQVFNQKLYAVFGGSHLVEADEPRIIRTRDYLQQNGAPFIALGHCTGPLAYDLLQQEIPHILPLYTGARYQL
ncbi:MBL fold metallo-hydrolase [Gracilinema caldarium]|uniref:Beta-lactamase domain protein n=1 Tax=Gracilinema caldarium (strain ATCC 51460 / DSM 7334 / H1) TaxID=744872 RepID=F8EZV6_GRAC1|nr:MBL fold metallo-hydrolase [Gracilinema caldarium]AEJ18469.1 beta-lactamase domain protein [Gracilinema caldarium DSM 7334]